MSIITIVSVSTIVHQLNYLFEAWQSNFDNPLLQTGQLKQSETNTQFFVEICVTGELNVHYDDKIFPEIELTISRHRWIDEDYDNFFAVDVLSGASYWVSENVDDQPVVDLALDLTNHIRLALSLLPLKKLKGGQRFLLN